MADILFTITDAGRAALINAANTGTDAVQIASAGLSATAVTATPAMTALPGEFKRVASLSGDTAADDTIHLIIRDESADAFSVRSIALYLDDGTLFGLYGQSVVILEKTTQSMMLLGVDVKFANVDATTITFGDANFLNPPATTERMGVAELATLAETIAGLDASRVPAAKMVKDAVAAWLDARFGAGNSGIWHPGNDGAGSGMDADLLDGQHGSYYLSAVNLTGTVAAARLSGIYDISVSGSATTLTTARNISLTGDATGTVAFNGSLNVGIAVTLTAASVVAKLLTVDGSGSGVDADLLDGQHGAFYADIAARLGFTPLNATAYTAADVKTKLLTVDGAGSGFDADLLDGQQGSYYTAIAARLGYTPLDAADYTAADVKTKLLTVDGAGSGFDADLLDGQQGAYYLNAANLTGTVPAARLTGTYAISISGSAAALTTARSIALSGDVSGSASFNGSANISITASLAPASVLAKLVTVDGSGSGLDADMLDGYQAAAFERVVEQSLSSNGGYTIYASGRKETWGFITIGQDAYATYTLPCDHTSWVHPTFGLSSVGGNTQIQQNTGITSINGAPPTGITFWNADDRTVTIWVRTIGV